MNIVLKIRDFIRKLQALPEKQRYIIMWSVVGVLGVVGLVIWFKIVEVKFRSLDINRFFQRNPTIEKTLIEPDATDIPDVIIPDNNVQKLETN